MALSYILVQPISALWIQGSGWWISWQEIESMKIYGGAGEFHQWKVLLIYANNILHSTASTI